MKRALCTFFVLAFGVTSLAAPQGGEIDRLMKEARIPGLAIAVIENSKVSRTGLVGAADAESGRAVTPETLFEAASLSKPVLATIVLKMAARGEIDLDRPLQEIMPFERLAGDQRAASITARLVLSHQTGLPNWGPDELELIFEPGTGFGYSGEGYVYLQRVVEKLTGIGLDELARKEVFEPLGMASSHFVIPEGAILALPHDQAGRAQDKRIPEQANAASSLHTTVADYARFVIAWMNGEVIDLRSRKRAIEAAVSMRGDETRHELAAKDWSRIAWGLGWGLQLGTSDAIEPILWHWGDNGPFKAFVAFRPGDQSGIVYFANSSNGLAIGPQLVAEYFADMGSTFAWCGYEHVDSPGFVERLEATVAESEGRLKDAIAGFKATVAVDPDDGESARRVIWLSEIADLDSHPIEVDEAKLEAWAGNYGPRRLSVGESGLIYRRDGGTPHDLVALGERLFFIDGFYTFRLEVVLDEEGRPSKLVGHYLDGRTDESLRSAD